MNRILKCFLITVITWNLWGCEKSKDIYLDGGVLNVTNTVIGGSTVSLNTNPSIISTINTVGINAYAFMPIATGQIRINLSAPAIAATATSPAIPSIIYFDQTLNITSEKNYSLFLTGTSPANVESVLIDEKYSRTYDDSICGVRIINLAPGSPAISVNIKGEANGSEVSSLAYKTYSNFIQHPAKATNTSYVFEFRNASTGTLIVSYTLPTPFFHNVTLAFRGIVGGSPAPGITLNNDY